jgi:hypothetical protein
VANPIRKTSSSKRSRINCAHVAFATRRHLRGTRIRPPSGIHRYAAGFRTRH